MDIKEFGTYLATLRKEAGYRSQSALGRVADVSNSTIARLERGDTLNPDYDTLVKLAPHLGITVEQMLQAAGYITVKDDRDPDKKRAPGIEDRLAGIVAELPDEARKSLEDFIEYLYIKHNVKPKLTRNQ